MWQGGGTWWLRYRGGVFDLALHAAISPATTLLLQCCCSMRGRYPKSCGENYMQYIMWSGVTNFAVTANSGALHMWFPLLQKPRLCSGGSYFSSRNSHCCPLISLPALALLTTHVAARCTGRPASAGLPLPLVLATHMLTSIFLTFL